MKIGLLQKKILLCLTAGAVVSFTYSFSRRRRIYKELGKELQKINRSALREAIDNLYKNKCVDFKEGVDGLITLILEDDGQKKILSYKIDEIQIKKQKHWDKKWRIVIFDVPHSFKKIRDALRGHLKRLGFYALQKSVWIFPHDCQKEIDFLIEFYSIRKYVRQIIATKIDNELHLKEIFNIGN